MLCTLIFLSQLRTVIVISKIWPQFWHFIRSKIYNSRCATCLLPTRSSQRGDFGTFSTCPLLVSLPSRWVVYFSISRKYKGWSSKSKKWKIMPLEHIQLVPFLSLWHPSWWFTFQGKIRVDQAKVKSEKSWLWNFFFLSLACLFAIQVGGFNYALSTFKIRWCLFCTKLWWLFIYGKMMSFLHNSSTIFTFRCSYVVYHNHNILPFLHCIMSTFVNVFILCVSLTFLIFPQLLQLFSPLRSFSDTFAVVKSKTSMYSQMQGILGPPTVYYYIQVTEQMLMEQPPETLVGIL